MPPVDELVAFWDHFYQSSDYPRALDQKLSQALLRADQFFQIEPGATVLDLGCGPGMSSLFWASRGAQVTAVDYSPFAIDELDKRCQQMGITNVTPRICDAMRLENLGQFDFVFGSMILHHLEPFEQFATVLRQTLRPAGKAFFYENNGASDLLIWFRDNVVGRFGVPKIGDAEESPLAPKEIDILRQRFAVEVEYPEMVFFQLATPYLLRGRFGATLSRVDNFLYSHKVGQRFSYRQYVLLRA
jgi:SAM-dependent methyltransferase